MVSGSSPTMRCRSPLKTLVVVGLQILPAWQKFFNHPNGKTLGAYLFSIVHGAPPSRNSNSPLGLISAAQVIGSILVSPPQAALFPRPRADTGASMTFEGSSVYAILRGYIGPKTNAVHRRGNYARRRRASGRRDIYPNVHRRTRFKCVHDLLLSFSRCSHAFQVGFGLTFALNTAPLLITELAYPTQVRY